MAAMPLCAGASGLDGKYIVLVPATMDEQLPKQDKSEEYPTDTYNVYLYSAGNMVTATSPSGADVSIREYPDDGQAQVETPLVQAEETAVETAAVGQADTDAASEDTADGSQGSADSSSAGSSSAAGTVPQESTDAVSAGSESASPSINDHDPGPYPGGDRDGERR